MMSTPWRSASICGRGLTPPKIRIVRWRRWRPKSSNDWPTWAASSRVGTSTSRRGAREPRGFGCSSARLLQQRQREGRRLAGAGLGGGQQVAAVVDGGNGALLDGRRGDVAQFLDGAQEFGRQAELIE